jgi:succinoglycan biosynthesis protein ExoO
MASQLVTIITPVFRGIAVLAESVRSVLQQSHSNWELLIVADDGLDYQAALSKHGIQDKRLKFLQSGGHGLGPNRARNIGLENARGEWIAPLDADDVYFPQRLERLLHKAQETGLALDEGRVVDQQNRRSLGGLLPADLGMRFELNDYLETDRPLLFLFHRSLITRGWDLIERGADTLFNLRALERAGYAGIDDSPLHEYRVGPTSLCHADDSSARFEEAYNVTLDLLRSDGLGFVSNSFRERVIAYVERKQALNRAYGMARREGFQDSFQHFVEATLA